MFIRVPGTVEPHLSRFQAIHEEIIWVGKPNGIKSNNRRNNTMAIKFARRFITVSGAALGAYILLFRPWQHGWRATDEEVKCTLPGDELVPHPDVNLTRAITIRASPPKPGPGWCKLGKEEGDTIPM